MILYWRSIWWNKEKKKKNKQANLLSYFPHFASYNLNEEHLLNKTALPNATAFPAIHYHRSHGSVKRLWAHSLIHQAVLSHLL